MVLTASSVMLSRPSSKAVTIMRASSWPRVGSSRVWALRRSSSSSPPTSRGLKGCAALRGFWGWKRCWRCKKWYKNSNDAVACFSTLWLIWCLTLTNIYILTLFWQIAYLKMLIWTYNQASAGTTERLGTYIKFLSRGTFLLPFWFARLWSRATLPL